MMNLTRRRALALVSGLPFASRMALAQTPALKPIKFATSLPTMTTVPIFLMKSLKIDHKHGLDVELIQMGGASTLMVDAVISGNALFASPGTATAMQAIRAGGKIQILGAHVNNQIGAVISKSAMAKTGLTDKSPFADRIRAMKGLTIGTNPVGATYYQMFRSYLIKYGLDPDKDVRLVAIADANGLIGGIQQGRLDAVVSATGVVEQAISLGVANMWFAGATGDLPGVEDELVSVIITRTETIEKDKATVDTMRAALIESLTLVQNDRVRVGEVLQKEYFNKLEPAVWKLVWDGAVKGYPTNLVFPKATFDYWAVNDPKGAESYKDVDWSKITYAPAKPR